MFLLDLVIGLFASFCNKSIFLGRVGGGHGRGIFGEE